MRDSSTPRSFTRYALVASARWRAMTSGFFSPLSAWPTMMTRLRGSCLRREATSSRQALSTLFRRDRFRGNPPDTQTTASGFGASTFPMLTGQVDCADPPRPSDTLTVMVAEAGGVMPVLSKVTEEPVPTTLPAVVLHS